MRVPTVAICTLASLATWGLTQKGSSEPKLQSLTPKLKPSQTPVAEKPEITKPVPAIAAPETLPRKSFLPDPVPETPELANASLIPHIPPLKPPSSATVDALVSKVLQEQGVLKNESVGDMGKQYTTSPKEVARKTLKTPLSVKALPEPVVVSTTHPEQAVLLPVPQPPLTQAATPVIDAAPQTPVSPPPPLPTTAPSQNEIHALVPGDRIALNMLQAPQYSGEYEILPDGSLNLPLAGKVMVSNMTLPQATDAIAAKYNLNTANAQVITALVTPQPVNVASQKVNQVNPPGATPSMTQAAQVIQPNVRPSYVNVAVVGEVLHPGSYTVQAGGGPNEGVSTVSQVLRLAGGITPSADVRRIQVHRPTAVGTELINVDLWQILQTGNLALDVTLQQGDSISVPKATALKLSEAPQLVSPIPTQIKGLNQPRK